MSRHRSQLWRSASCGAWRTLVFDRSRTWPLLRLVAMSPCCSGAQPSCLASPHFTARLFQHSVTPVCPVHGSDASANTALGLSLSAASGTRPAQISAASAARLIRYRSSARPLFRSANLFRSSDASPIQCTAFRCFGCSCARLSVLGLYSVGLLRRFVFPALDSSTVVGSIRRFLFISIHLLWMLFCSLLL